MNAIPFMHPSGQAVLWLFKQSSELWYNIPGTSDMGGIVFDTAQAGMDAWKDFSPSDLL